MTSENTENTENSENGKEALHSQQAKEPAEGGYGSPLPEDELPTDVSSNPGSPDPTLRGQESDQRALSDDESLGAPDRNFFQDEEAGSDGEPGAGRLGGTDDQLREEQARSNDGQSPTDERSDVDLPSTEAPLDEGNAGPTREQRESFSSEPGDDAAGESS